MAITKERLIGDIILQLNGGNISDDSELEPLQVAQWAEQFLHQMIREEIISEMKKGNMPPPIYITREEGLELSEENVAEIADAKQRMWVDLTNDVLDLPNDRGIIRVEDYDGNLIMKTSLDQLSMVRDLRFSKPTADKPLYYRIGTKVFIEGVPTAEIDFNPFIVYYVPKQDIIAMADGDDILVSDQLLPLLIATVVQHGKLMLYGTQQDMTNDGVDNKQTMYHTAIARPDSQNQQPTE